MKKKQDSAFEIPSRIQGCLLLAFSFFLGLSLISYVEQDSTRNWLGLTGHVAGFGAFYLWGLASFTLPFFLGWLAIRQILKRPIPHLRWKLFYFAVILIALSVLLSMASQEFPKFASLFKRFIYGNFYPKRAYYDPSKFRYYLGGVPMHRIYTDFAVNFRRFLGGVGTFLIFSSLFLIASILLTNFPLGALFGKLKVALKKYLKKRPQLKPALAIERKKPFEDFSEDPKLIREDPLKREFKINFLEKKTPIQAEKVIEVPPKNEPLSYSLPGESLLTEIKEIDQSSLKNDLKKQAEILEETLLSFGIEAKVGDIHCGPTITSFEVHPAVGVKVQKIKALENDIALNLQARSIRIIAPIPGKAAVGIEVPNAKPQEVGFRDLLESYKASHKKATIPLLLGKVVNGDDVWADLTKCPHLIIAGATGSGKSVCINTIVMSIVMNANPEEIKLLMVDPKKVELSAYTRLPHMLAPVITEPSSACAALGWLVKEMERRYEVFRQLGIRNIHSFNSRNANKELEESLDITVPEKMPYIVVIIDELADLMMVSSSDIETPIARIAQMARAVGIHMILATQRPSREVITGIIKANFPCRIAFKVSSRVNSQIVIDENGAETLLGNGDMLFLPPGTSTLVRAQGAFIRDDDINKIIKHICSQAPVNYLIPSFDNYRDSQEDRLDSEAGPRDALFEDAKKLVYETANASTTFLQRKLKVGYARAASLMDQLEDQGIIGPPEGAKPRKIFYPSSDEDL